MKTRLLCWSPEPISILVKTKRETAPIAEMLPIIEATVNDGKPVEMTVTGNSMKPLLKDRVSSVRLGKPDNLKKGDVVLFLRNDGHCVLHRIISIHDELYDIVGDNQIVPDRNIPKEKIIAKVCEYSRNGKAWKERDGLYRMALPLIKTARRYGKGIKRRLVMLTKHQW